MCNQWGHHDTCPKSNFYNLGKLEEGIRNHRNKICTYRTQDLNSSALGENKLCYFTMDGRILFDIQKEVEKLERKNTIKKLNEDGRWLILIETPFEIELPWRTIQEVNPIQVVRLSDQ